MMVIRPGPAGVLTTVLLLGTVQILSGQALGPRLTTWRPTLENEITVPLAPFRQELTSAETHSHTLTGLLIGGLVGVVATGVFLAGFCSDADTQCGADEVGRAVVIIAVPPAIVGAVIGSLIRTES
jgi:hypothetical protein